MNKLVTLKFIALLCFTIPAITAKSQTHSLGNAITFGKDAKNISRITNDTLVLLTGNTYLFTVIRQKTRDWFQQKLM